MLPKGGAQPRSSAQYSNLYGVLATLRLNEEHVKQCGGVSLIIDCTGAITSDPRAGPVLFR